MTTADWDAFAAAPTAEARGRAWLVLLAGRLPKLCCGVILIESLADQSYAPLAVWPKPGQTAEREPTPDPGRLAAAVESVLQSRRSAVKATPDGNTQIACPIWAGERIVGIVALETAIPRQEAAPLLQEIHWGAAWLAHLFTERERLEALTAKERLGAVLETVAPALKSRQKLQEALIDLANALCRQFNCSRTAIGLVQQRTVRLAVLSDAATFDKRSSLARAYEQAMSEAHESHGVVVAPPMAPQDGEAPRHDELLALSGAKATLSYPWVSDTRCVGILTLERETPFSEEDRLWLEAFGILIAPIVELRQKAEQSALRRLGIPLVEFFEKLLGPRHLTWKVVTLTLLGGIAALTLTTIDYRVSARTVIEGEVQRVIAAPFAGFLAAAPARAGDEVTTGQILARLDERELRIEEARWTSERDQYANRLREATARHDLTAMEVIGAQYRQAEAQRRLVSGKIARAELKAPFAGVVVSGDLSQQIGAPVEEGQTLFEVAPLSSYRVILQVDEREIRHIAIGQSGALVMTGIAGEPMPFRVAKLTPVASAEDGRNVFRVEAALAQASPRLRPGMEGVGKIEVGRRSPWWVATHGFGDWLSLWLWTWMP
jgi:multidrug efflux pump subunit AcrA (membrane-fusion protein)